MKQTAVEWLLKQYIKNNGKITNSDVAKTNQMFEEQIKEAYLSGADHLMDIQYNPSSYFNDEQYYNETFKSE